MTMFAPKREFKTTTSMDFWKIMAGDRLGYGMSRSVYDCRLDPTLVMKIEVTEGKFQNIVEFELWSRYMHYEKVAKWLAPVDSMSSNGTVMLMKKTMPLTVDQFPDEIPAFFGDIKLENFGMLDGRVVCHDYGTGFHENPRSGNRKVKKGVDWVCQA
jgi:hypothetical protein